MASRQFEEYLRFIEFFLSAKKEHPFMTRYSFYRILFDSFSHEWQELEMIEKLVILKEPQRCGISPHHAYLDFYMHRAENYYVSDLHTAGIKALGLYIQHLLSPDFDWEAFNEFYLQHSDRLGSLQRQESTGETRKPVTLKDILHWLVLGSEENLFEVADTEPSERLNVLLMVYVREQHRDNPMLVTADESAEDEAVRVYLERIDDVQADMKSRVGRFPFALERLMREVSEEYRTRRIDLRDTVVEYIKKQDVPALNGVLSAYLGRTVGVGQVYEIKKYKQNFLFTEVIRIDPTLYLDYEINDEKGTWTEEDRWLDDPVTIGEAKSGVDSK